MNTLLRKVELLERAAGVIVDERKRIETARLRALSPEDLAEKICGPLLCHFDRMAAGTVDYPGNRLEAILLHSAKGRGGADRYGVRQLVEAAVGAPFPLPIERATETATPSLTTRALLWVVEARPIVRFVAAALLARGEDRETGIGRAKLGHLEAVEAALRLLALFAKDPDLPRDRETREALAASRERLEAWRDLLQAELVRVFDALDEVGFWALDSVKDVASEGRVALEAGATAAPSDLATAAPAQPVRAFR
ncbi:MAG: hypothetical protein HYZ53_24690 [Planctomycetes bacterium]|nr:hypothetical protein [Planctomycetota bacterium]